MNNPKWCVSLFVLLRGGSKVVHEVDTSAKVDDIRKVALHAFTLALNEAKADRDHFRVMRDGRDTGWLDPSEIIGVDVASVHELSGVTEERLQRR